MAPHRQDVFASASIIGLVCRAVLVRHLWTRRHCPNAELASVATTTHQTALCRVRHLRTAATTPAVSRVTALQDAYASAGAVGLAQRAARAQRDTMRLQVETAPPARQDTAHRTAR